MLKERVTKTIEENDTKTAVVSNGVVRGGRPYGVVGQG